MADGKLAAELVAIRERAEQITDDHDEDDCDLNGARCTGHDAVRLLDGYEELITLAGGWAHEAARLDDDADDAAVRGAGPLRTADLAARAVALEMCAEAVQSVISRALLGEDGTGDT